MHAVNKSTPFIRMAMHPETLACRLLGRLPTQNAFVEFNNHLASAPSVFDVTRQIVNDLDAKYNVILHKQFRQELDDLYSRYMQYCLRDAAITEDEINAIWHLKDLCDVTDEYHNNTFRSLGIKTFRKAVKLAMDDLIIDKIEIDRLESLAAELELSEEDANKVFTQEVDSQHDMKIEALKKRAQAAIIGSGISEYQHKKLHDFAQQLELDRNLADGVIQDALSRHFRYLVKSAIDDGLLTPDEDELIEQATSQLGSPPELDSYTVDALNRCRLMWQIQAGALPVLDPGISLPKTEQCHFKKNVNWHEMRKQRVGLAYNGPTARIKIAKGIYWRAGVLGGKPITRDTLVKIDSGTIYITSKRILFKGAMINTSIRLNKIIDIEPYKDGVVLQKDAGKSPFLEFNQDIDIFCATVARIMKDI